MKQLLSRGRFLVLTLGLVLAVAGSAAAQQGQTITQSDVQRLQDALADAGRDISGAHARDAALASRLEGELNDLRDEAAYLRVKLRRNEPVPRADYFTLRDRIDDLRAKARGDSTRPGSATGASTASRGSGSSLDVPAGTEFDVRLGQTLSSSINLVEDRFEATTLVDLMENDRVIVPAGSVMRGVVSSVTKAGRVERTGKLTVAFDQVTINRKAYPIRGTVSQALESEGVRGEAGKIGAGAGVGAIIGGILGGLKGAMAGILIGGGGTIAATEGKDVDLPAGTVLRVRLDSGLSLR
ncbi:MAG TPA: hypothetical protein VM032_03485 [Vicinamibacterales bacterium]|nr:hypothetical protein [Vicinamibacterales bacterium]